MPPNVSVIIPVYNRAGTIQRTINSVVAQTYQDLEIIVVDDGSTDQTSEVVEQVGDMRIRVIRHAINKGAAEARNTGMKAAAGKYIAWLDSDDEWLCDKLQVQLDAFVQAAPDQKACYTSYEIIDQQFGSEICIPKYTDYKKLFLSCDIGPGSTLLFDRSVLDKIGYLDSSFIRYEDWDWLLRYCADYRLLPVEKPLARIYFTSMRSSKDIEFSALNFISKYSNDLKQYGVYRKIVISRRWMEVARYYAQEHNLAKILRFVGKGVLAYPFQPIETWKWLINSWFGIRMGSLQSKLKALFINSRD
jgi:glycosyltransferase involved in cell wall biosynthesis